MVFNQHNSDACLPVQFPQKVHQLQTFRRIHARRGFIQEQKLWTGSQSAGDLHLTLQTVGQGAHLRVAVLYKAHLIQILQTGLLDLLIPFDHMGQPQHGGYRVVAGPAVQTDGHIFQRRHSGIDADVLECAGNA